MKNQLLNLKMIALMCLMMVLGGANVWAADVTYTHTFKKGDFGTAPTVTSYSATLTGVSWDVSAPETFNYFGSGTDGFQVGSKNNPCKSLKLSTNGISGVIKSIELETRTAGTRTLAISVGGTDYTCNSKTSVSLTTTSKKYKFVGNASGEVVISLTNGSKALFLKSLTIVYEGESQQGGNTLTISPTETSSVKAPIQVSLEASIKGSKIYYTTDNTEPTTESNLYSAPFEVTKSGTTVKALAVADGAENVTAEATYTIKPEQPVFSAESKTFKDAFDVTLSLPGSTNATSKIYYKINGTATAESTPYNGPINISAENDGDKVILHAVVVDEYGNVGQEKYCTYTKNTDIVFDFTSDWEGITATEPKNNQTNVGQVVAGKELKVEGVVMTATNGEDSNNNPFFTGLYIKSGQHLRVYVKGLVTFTAPEGYNLSEVTFTGSNTTNFTTADGAYKNSTWTGNAHAVTFTASGTVQVKTATIKLVAAEPVKPTFGTLDFKAHDGDGFHYATFSSDKDVVFNQKSVDVYAVSVSNEKVDTKILDAASYNVTDATVGSIEKGYYVPANTGVLIVGIDATTTYYFPAKAQTVTLPDNQLKPAPANGGEFTAEKDDCKYYKLAYNDYDAKTGLGFYWGADNGGAFYVKAGTAYLAVPAGDATAKGFAFNGEATGIEGVNANVENAKAIYNLNGQRVASMAKPGLYIVNGKKVVRK